MKQFVQSNVNKTLNTGPFVLRSVETLLKMQVLGLNLGKLSLQGYDMLLRGSLAIAQLDDLIPSPQINGLHGTHKRAQIADIVKTKLSGDDFS
jgi:hypothetical protein